MVSILAEPLTWLQEWQAVISGLGSLVLSFFLVGLYWKQHGLLKRELNREVRKNHTETLRKRIRAWHGDLDEVGTSTDKLYGSDSTKLPDIGGASVTPAPPATGDVTFDPEFRVVPERIENDKYLYDLLENHAPDLKNLKQTIEEQYEDFVAARKAFSDEFSVPEPIEADEYTTEPLDRFPLWAFEQAVIYHRERRDLDEMRIITREQLDGTDSARSNPGLAFYKPVHHGRATYQVDIESDDLRDLEEFEDEVTRQVTDIHLEVINDIGEEGVYRHAVEAGEILDEMEESIEKLRSTLVEYEGHPLYTGDCQYIQEASV